MRLPKFFIYGLATKDGRVLYVGQSGDPLARISHHMASGRSTHGLRAMILDVAFTRAEALRVESAWIKRASERYKTQNGIGNPAYYAAARVSKEATRRIAWSAIEESIKARGDVATARAVKVSVSFFRKHIGRLAMGVKFARHAARSLGFGERLRIYAAPKGWNS